MHQLALFEEDAPTLPPGLEIHSGFISPEEEGALLAHAGRGLWNTEISRRTQQYGFRYSLKDASYEAAETGCALPAWSAPVLGRVRGQGLSAAVFTQLSINEYQPGQGIALHTDREGPERDEVLILSLGSPCAMEFFQPSGACSLEIMLWPRSLLLMRDEARHHWQHGIPRRKSDWVNNQRLPRGRRISLSFRSLGGDGP